MKLLYKAMCAGLLLALLAPGISAAETIEPLLPSADVLLDVGHGGIDSGTLFGKYEEKDMNLAIAKKTYKLLRKKGYRVILNRDSDYALSDDNTWSSGNRHKKDLAQRSGLANTVRPKMMLSLHVNWSGKPAVRGPVMIYQNQSDSILLAHLLQQSLNKLYGTSEPPMLGRTYYVLRHTKCPTVIVEMGFITNRADRKLLNDSHGQNQIAEAIGSAVEHYFAMIHPN
ncbi:N-acetylmuramoyl-L-alanine amidase [Paenibacillus athensensis]|uniref:MurNAc-LAA domain-containing protein n=1 Tax=Paenibacillus athensensis TaxID=1967502 RepID=A0A4Y8PSD7_9BACL|nr:N-acetylmuramoyl-L-alanine amidase [Paenibacillus athensensis]MCD1258148.1 N-acetylmuramoyl-L-alanine amidase [Paenibacillus athensensis]